MKKSYCNLIIEAILNSGDKKIFVSDIYKFIETNYYSFCRLKKNWKNSIRHALSFRPYFKKFNRMNKDRGCLWGLSEGYF